MENDFRFLQPQEHKYHRHVSVSDLQFRLEGIQMTVNWIAKVSSRQAWSYSEHKHSGLEVHFISQGECELANRNEKHTIHKGEFCIVPSGVIHSQETYQRSRAVEYSLNLSMNIEPEKYCSKNPLHLAIRYIQLSQELMICKDSFDSIRLFKRIFQEDEHQQAGRRFMIQSLTSQLIVEVLRKIIEEQRMSTVTHKLTVDKERMDEIDEIILRNLTDHITLKDVSGIMHLSEKQISRTVSNVRQKSFRQYVLEIKCEKAMVYLSDPDQKIKDVAEKLGFSSCHYFSRLFYKRFGMLPSEYQKYHFQHRSLMSR